MAEQAYPFSSGAGASITDAQFRAYIKALASDGVIAGVGATLGCSAGSGMASNVGTGAAIGDGLFYNNDATKAVTHTTSSPSNPRIDLVVAHWNLTSSTDAAGVSAYSAAALILPGTPAGSPVAPTVTQNANMWEVALSQVLVPTSAASAAAFTYTDVRTYTGPAGYTPAIALAAMKTVDGSGSGLDADLLDGHDTSYFLQTLQSAGGGAAGTKIWVGTTDPGGSAGEGDIWIKS